MPGEGKAIAAAAEGYPCDTLERERSRSMERDRDLWSLEALSLICLSRAVISEPSSVSVNPVPASTGGAFAPSGGALKGSELCQGSPERETDLSDLATAA